MKAMDPGVRNAERGVGARMYVCAIAGQAKLPEFWTSQVTCLQHGVKIGPTQVECYNRAARCESARDSSDHNVCMSRRASDSAAWNRAVDVCGFECFDSMPNLMRSGPHMSEATQRI